MLEIRKYLDTTFSSLKKRNFRLYLLGQAISISGTFMQAIAQDWLVLKLTGSGTALGIVTALQYLPILLLAVYGGVIADRYPKRNILFLTQSAYGVLALIMGALVVTNSASIWAVYALALAFGLVSCIDNPTRQSFVLELVGKDEVRNAVTLFSSEVNLARVIGPLAAGSVIATVGLAPCFFINAASYIAVITGLLLMDGKELAFTAPPPGKKGQLMEGIRYALSTPVLRISLLMMLIIGMFTYEFQISLPLIAQFTLKGDAETYAALSAAMGIGSVIGGLAIAGQKKVSQPLLIGSAFLLGASILVASVMPSLILILATLLAAGAASVYFISLSNSILQLESAPEMRGRIMSFWSIAFLGTSAIGGPIIGLIGENAGPRWGLAAGGIAAIAAAMLGSTLNGKSASEKKRR